MSEFWQHILIGAVPALMVLGMWLETRDRLTRIETKIEPMWNWWNKTNGK